MQHLQWTRLTCLRALEIRMPNKQNFVLVWSNEIRKINQHRVWARKHHIAYRWNPFFLGDLAVRECGYAHCEPRSLADYRYSPRDLGVCQVLAVPGQQVIDTVNRGNGDMARYCKIACQFLAVATVPPSARLGFHSFYLWIHEFYTMVLDSSFQDFSIRLYER